MSFGSSGFGGFGSNTNNNNQQQQQQQQQQQTGFGGFGSNTNANTNTGAFGATGNTGFGATTTNTGNSLFGSNTNTSSGFGSGGFGTNTNTSTSAFGAPKPFGASNNTTGGGGLFGNNTSNTNTASTFGGFGANTTNTTTGFGSSGGTAGGLFGNNTNTNQPATGFGASTTGNSLFGSNNQTSGFGNSTTNTGFGASTSAPAFGANAPSTQNNGTGTTPFSPHSEKDAGNNQNQLFQSITCMPPYQAFQFEELRAVDYNQGRQYGNQSGQPGAFGATTGFGGGFGQNNTTPNNTTTGFGNTSGAGLFGNQNQSNPFGTNTNTNNTNTGFGAAAGGGGLFGNKPNTTPGGLFGNNANTNTNQTSGGLFNSSTTAGFGTNQANNTGFGNNTAAGGLFGNQNNQQKPSLFGATNTATPAFGNSNTNTTGFGATNNTAGGLFGNTNTQQQPNQTGFGAQNTNTTGTGGGGLFGNLNQNQNNQQSGGLFGNSFGTQNQQKPSLFGTTPTNTTGGLFGQNNNQPQQQNQPAAGGLFGNPNQPAVQSGGLFGQNNQQKPTLFGATQTAPQTGGGLFGNLNNNNPSNTGNSLFGQPQNQQKPSLFGSTPANNAPAGGLFGGLNQSNTNQPSGGLSLFGNTAQSQQPQLGNTLSAFGNSQQPNLQQQQQPQQLTTSIMSNNPYGNEHLFVNLGTPNQSIGPLMTPLSSAQKARKPMPLPTYRLNPNASTRLLTPQKRSGFGFDYSNYGTPGSAMSNASPFGRSVLSRSLGRSASASNLRGAYNADESILAPGAFSAGGMRSGSGNMKKLKINRNLRTDLFGNDTTNDAFKASPLKKKVSFEGNSSAAGTLQNVEHGALTNGETSTDLVPVEDPESPTPSAEEQGYLRPSRNSRQNLSTPSTGAAHQPEMEQVKGNELAIVPEDDTPPSSRSAPAQHSISPEEGARLSQKDMEPGDYYMIPSRAEIQKMSRKDRSKISPFVVGREHTGKIEFDQVDLSNVDLDKIMGEIVQITPRSATVYPNHATKPPLGQGMNFPARITLDNSWPRARGGRVPVFERKGPRFEKHLERLKRVAGTEFEQYLGDKGQWIFRVPHFSTYALDYSDEEDGLFGSPSASAFLSRNLQDSPSVNQHQRLGSSAYPSGPEDTFDFRNNKALPGGFDYDEDYDVDENDDDEPLDDYLLKKFAMEEAQAAQDAPMPEAEPDIFDADAQFDGVIDDDSPKAHAHSLVSPIKPKSILKSNHQPLQGFGTPSAVAGGQGQDWASQLQRTLSPKKQNRQALRESQGTFLRELQQPAPDAPAFDRDHNPFATSIDVMNSLFGQNKNVRARARSSETKGFQWPYAKRTALNADEDMSEADRNFHNSFKPSWAFDGSFIYAASGPASGTVPVKTRIAFEGNDNEFGCFAAITPADATPTVIEQQTVTAITLDDGCPYAHTTNQLSFGALADAVTGDDPESKHERLMWRLASVLFDEETYSQSQNPEFERKKAFSTFWAELVLPATKEQLTSVHGDNKHAEAAIINLAGHDVAGAVASLAEGKNYRLATMIAQIGGDEAMRNGYATQLDEWRRTNTLSEIVPPIRALYELLAGHTCTAEGKAVEGPENRAETFNISSKFGLDWRRAFGLKLWYGKLWEEDSLAEVIKAYDADLESRKEQAKPLPWFLEQDLETGWDDPNPQDRQDILFGLLKIYALYTLQKNDEVDTAFETRVKLADIISPQNVSGNPTEARLSFQLYHTLVAKGIIDFPEDERDHKSDLLATDYAFQLSADPTNIHDAIFVILHLTSATRREDAVRALLNRHAGAIEDKESSDIFASLATDLRIPAPWIWSAKALYAKAVSADDRHECFCLLKAGKNHLHEAHDTFRRTLAPRCVIEEDLHTLREVLGWFKEVGAQALKGWDVGGGLYDAYIQFLDLARHGDKNEMADISASLGRTLEELAGSSLGLVERVAVTEMAEGMRKAVVDLQWKTGVDLSASRGAPLPSFPTVASDDGLQRALKLSESYYSSVLVGGS